MTHFSLSKTIFHLRFLCTAGILISVFFLLTGLFRLERETQLQAQLLSNSVLRFHIRANSDSDEDQQLKLRVRDGILAWAAPLLDRTSDRSEAETILREHLSELTAEAERLTTLYGNGESVQAQLMEERFPVRVYGTHIFPAGTYHSLSLSIGSGSGHNWWCVLYPTLCFQDAASGEVTAESDEMLSTLLPDDTEKTGQIVFRFRFLTFLNRFL